MVTGKPKFFIFQACQEGLEQSYSHAADDSDARGQLHSDDKPLSEKLHQDSDILLSFATTPGYVAYRKVPHAENQWIGAWFIHALLDVFENKYKDIDVMKMLEEVRRNLNAKADYRPQDGKCQMSEDVSTLTKTFFL
ncbi:caspase-7-like [Mytilus edulis]|uniref:caspase-7-like n=1 Tax=Mytilus edulis TaxID=6550 RepID=UPI0039EF9341